jgi:AraC family transcriptional regulator, exoenzyme S synthesis regulatory protein ExsA
MLIAPKGLFTPELERKILKFKNLTVFESCTNVHEIKSNTMFLEDHLLLVVLDGFYNINHNEQRYSLQKNQMVLLKKAISIKYEKSGDFMMFFLKENFLKEFVQHLKIHEIPKDELVPVSVIPVDERLIGFIESLKPYMNEKNSIDEYLIKIKMIELLYDLGNINRNLLHQLLQLNNQTRQNLGWVLENNYMNPVTLKDLAYLSGRSLSGFKRDFSFQYNMPPSQWIRERRLAKAKELLTKTEMTVTDICFESGFENVSHFSRLFKEHYGYSPSTYRKD